MIYGCSSGTCNGADESRDAVAGEHAEGSELKDCNAVETHEQQELQQKTLVFNEINLTDIWTANYAYNGLPDSAEADAN
eukprot:655191-Amphidinium_carterae.1